jgi:uncharacterized protein (TIGR03435 family)
MTPHNQRVFPEPLSTRGVKAPVLRYLAPAIAAICCASVRAQSSPPQSFDVISIKPNPAITSGYSIGDRVPGTFKAQYASLLLVIQYAYDVKAAQIEGLPPWAESERFDINAKIDDALATQEKSLPREQTALLSETRIQALLAERFALKLHHETKDMPVLALAVAKGGSKLVETALAPVPGEEHPLPPGSVMTKSGGTQSSITCNQASLKVLLNILASQAELSGHILLDQTGLTGKYTFTLQWTTQNLSAEAAASDSPGTSLFSALEEQLGLRLESTRAPVDVLVVDHVSELSPN